MPRRSLRDLGSDVLWGVSWSLIVATVFAGIAGGMYVTGLLRDHDAFWLIRVLVGYYTGGALAGAIVGLCRPWILQHAWISYAVAGLCGFLFGFAGMVLLEGAPRVWESWIWGGIALVTAMSAYHVGADLRRGVKWEELRRSGKLKAEQEKRAGRRVFRSWSARDD